MRALAGTVDATVSPDTSPEKQPVDDQSAEHASLRDPYEVSSPELDAPVDRLAEAVLRQPARTGLTPHVHPVEPVVGAGSVGEGSADESFGSA